MIRRFHILVLACLVVVTEELACFAELHFNAVGQFHVIS